MDRSDIRLEIVSYSIIKIGVLGKAVDLLVKPEQGNQKRLIQTLR